MADILIVGAGIAGFTAAQEIRERSPSTSVMLVDAEARLPYKRTKISKFLAEGFEHDAFALEDAEWYDRKLTLRAGCTVTSIDAEARTAQLSDGSVVTWNKLLLATGARAVVPTSGAREWLVLRSQDDAAKLRARWEHEREVVVLGNGVLGVEIAEQAVLAGKSVRLWGNTPPPLHRELTPQASKLLAQALADHGIVQEAPQSGDRPWAVAAIGSLPDLVLAKAAGVATEKGVLVDGEFRTSVDGIWAAGDGVQLPDGRVSHLWHESEAQGRAAALSMLGAPSFSPRPWRLKCDVFGTYWFSMGKPRDREPDVETQTGRVYQAFWYTGGKLSAAVMANDKDNNKLYEKAVLAGWSRDEVEKRLGV